MAAAKIEFERHRIAHRHCRRFDRSFGPQCAAEIGVQHRAGQIEHRLEVGLRLGLQDSHRGRSDCTNVGGYLLGGARGSQRLAHGGDYRGSPKALRRRNGNVAAQDFVD